MPEARQHQARFRPMTEADVQVTAYVRKAALESVARSQGRDPGDWKPNASPHFAHIIRTDPGGSWVAEINGLVVGYAQAILRGDIWFLCQLFVQPEVHARGVGQGVLERAMQYGRDNGARVFSVVSSTSPVAQSLYMRSGMYGIGIGYRLAGPVEPLLKLPEPGANRKRVVDCAGWQDQIAKLDATVFGAERRQDHALYLRERDPEVPATSFALTRDGDLLGYGYAERNVWGASIAPLAAYEPEDQLPLLRMAAEWLTEHEMGDANMFVLSLNHTLMRAALEAGWRIDGWTFLLSSEPFGQFDRYHPSGGLLL